MLLHNSRYVAILENEAIKTKTPEASSVPSPKDAALFENANTCISCGVIIPEGLLVCPTCMGGAEFLLCSVCGDEIHGGDTVCRRCRALLLEDRFQHKG